MSKCRIWRSTSWELKMSKVHMILIESSEVIRLERVGKRVEKTQNDHGSMVKRPKVSKDSERLKRKILS